MTDPTASRLRILADSGRPYADAAAEALAQHDSNLAESEEYALDQAERAMAAAVSYSATVDAGSLVGDRIYRSLETIEHDAYDMGQLGGDVDWLDGDELDWWLDITTALGERDVAIAEEADDDVIEAAVRALGYDDYDEFERAGSDDWETEANLAGSLVAALRKTVSA